MTPLIAHVAAGSHLEAGGNPLYDVLPGHEAGLLALAVVPVGAWLVHTRAAAGGRTSTRLVAGYLTLPSVQRLLVLLLLGSAAIHLGLAVGHVDAHGSGGLRLLVTVDAAILALAARSLLLGGRHWRAVATLALAGGLVAYWGAALAGEPPDQAGLATKLAELLALAIVLRPRPGRRVRGALASAMIVLLTALTATAGWIGAFAAATPEHAEAAGHAGLLPGPGTVFPAQDVDPATEADRVSAAALLAETQTAIAPFADPAVARAAGYDLDGLFGTGFHATNSAYEHDGRVLDASRPEMLVYAAVDGRPVLLGAVFTMPSPDTPGPRVAGPLVMWHAHEQVCVSLTPPSLTGLVSPLGGCPFGSFAVPLTAPMLHVWTVPGAPDPFGDLPDEWRRAYLEGLAQSPKASTTLPSRRNTVSP